jgi:ATP-dependent DNA helicase HFM1/MER3
MLLCRYFSSLQSDCFLSDVNMVISAPTGSGKTVLFELCILRVLSPDRRFNLRNGTLKTVRANPDAVSFKSVVTWNVSGVL